uniref:Uncharacterized protein n=1 Tax=Setaria italica TaxID=4555 RepID=K3ZGB3_SETIT
MFYSDVSICKLNIVGIRDTGSNMLDTDIFSFLKKVTCYITLHR